jgi:hypothetical protein
MWLLNVDTFETREFFGEETPEYAFLSHTWDSPEDEVTTDDLRGGKFREDVHKKHGFRKLDFAMKQARRDGLQWLWADTCCIDRANGADMTEAANALWGWLANSKACYAYLSDAPSVNDPASKAFMNARWFTRSWTLVELLAPPNLTFYTEDWTQVGVGSLRMDLGILEATHHITKIPREALMGHPITEFCIAQRLSWAALRRCRRVEDQAYSLFGLFDVNLPILYGEGKKAFIRRQEHLHMQLPHDHSIFAWTVPITSPRCLNISGIFAESPEDFANSGNIRPFIDEPGYMQARMSAKGLMTKMLVRGEIQFRDSLKIYWKNKYCEARILALNCGDETGQRVVLPVLQSSDESSWYYHVDRQDLRLSSAASTTYHHHEKFPQLFCRINVPKFEMRARQQGEAWRKPNKVLLRQTLSMEDQWFAKGGIHIQNMPPAPGMLSTWRENVVFEPSLGYHLAGVLVYGSWGRWSGHYSSIQFSGPLEGGTLETPAVVTLGNRSGRPAFSLIVGFTADIAYCGLSSRVNEPSLADVSQILAKGPSTHAFDYANRVGDIAEDTLRLDKECLVVRVRMTRESIGGNLYVAPDDLRNHFLINFSFEKVAQTASSSRRLPFMSKDKDKEKW